MISLDTKWLVITLLKEIAYKIGAPTQKISLFYKNKEVKDDHLPLTAYGISWQCNEGDLNFDYVGYNEIVKC